MIRVNIRTTSTSIVSLVELEQVIVCYDVIKCLLNDYWSTLKLLCIKCFPRSSNVFWYNALMYNLFLNKNAGDTFYLVYLTTRVPDTSHTSGIQMTRVEYEQYKCDTSVARVLHGQHKYITSTTRMTLVGDERQILIWITVRVKIYFRTTILAIWSMKNYKVRNNFILRTNFWKCLVPMPKCI